MNINEPLETAAQPLKQKPQSLDTRSLFVPQVLGQRLVKASAGLPTDPRACRGLVPALMMLVDEPKRPEEALKIDFEARKTHPRPPKNLPRPCHEGLRRLQNAFGTAQDVTKKLSNAF